MADEEDYAGPGDDAPVEDMLEEQGGLDAAEILAAEEAAAAAAATPLSALLKHHPECILEYAETVAPRIPLMTSPPLEGDPNHRSVPFLTQYERTKIIGMRANQLSQGARPYIPVPEHVTDVAEIARLELVQRRLPFLVRRPMPDGTQEYWRLSELLQL